MKTELRSLEGVKYRLAPLQVSQITDRYIGWLNQPEINRYLDVRFVPQDRETVSAYVRSFYGSEEKYIWGIYPKQHSAAAQDFVGTITLYLINRNHGSAYFGILVGEREHWGKGASTEAIRLLGDHTFGELGLRRLTAGTYAPNLGINFTLQKLGFRCEGKFKKAYRVDRESFTDGYFWAVLKDEWKDGWK